MLDEIRNQMRDQFKITRLRLGLRHLDIVPLGGTVHLCGQTDRQTKTDKHPESCSENILKHCYKHNKIVAKVAKVDNDLA